jgi:uncharacterized phage-associated protein
MFYDILFHLRNTEGANRMKRKALHSAMEVANAFLALAQSEGVRLTNMQLQKLVYIAYGFFAAVFNEQMFDDEIQAWSFGPVIPNLYHKLKRYGAGEVATFLDVDGQIEDNSPEMKIIESVWESYKDKSAPELSSLTHEEGTPWSKVWKKERRNTKIPHHEIKYHYEKLFKSVVNAE